MRSFISCARKIALQSPKETRKRVVGRSLGAKPQATEIVARSFGIVVLFSRMARATRVLVPLGWSHNNLTCESISSDHEVIAGCPAYSVSHTGWHMR